MTDAEWEALAERLRAAVSRFVRAARRRADALPPSRAETLRQLETAGPQTMAELAEARGVSHQSVSRMTADLEALGLVTRHADPADARAFRIELAAEGRRRLAADRLARRDLIAASIERALDARERAALARLPALLDRLSDAIDAP